MWTELEQFSTVPVRRMLVPVRPLHIWDFNCFSRPEGVSIPKRQLCNI